MMTSQQEIKHLCELARNIRRFAQNQYADGNRDDALDAVNYAEGLERAMLEIAALNDLETDEIDELRSFDADECRARFTSEESPDKGFEPFTPKPPGLKSAGGRLPDGSAERRQPVLL